MTEPQPSLASEVVTFIQHDLPGLEDGTYELTVEQHVDDAKDQPVSGKTIDRTWHFAITGDRFVLADPATSIASTFPVDNATGEYDTVLPHVVFQSTSLPWMRSPLAVRPPLPPAGLDADDDAPTWLAVLVLDETDAAAYPPGTGAPALELTPVTRSIGDLFPPAVVKTSTLGHGRSYFDGATTTDGLEIGERIGDPIQTIDIPLALFADVAPTLGDLELSAHVRRVDVENKPITVGQEPAVDPLGAFSIVIANRLPQHEQKSRAYLVSLEGLEALLPSDDAPGTERSAGAGDFVRLAVLRYWTFNSKGGSATFVDQLERLNDRTPGGPDAANTNLRLHKDGALPPVSGALAAGYAPLAHALRTGETTVSWYRGPLSPVNAEPTPIDVPISSPDEALAFDPTTGMFDTSLAAAWTIGRLAALQDQAFSQALYAWKQGLSRSVVEGVERELIAEAFAGLLGPSPVDPDRQQPKAGAPLLHDTLALLRQAERRR